MTTHETTAPRLEREEAEGPLYDVVSVLYHALKAAESASHYATAAESSGDARLAQFFRDMVAENRGIAARAKAELVSRLSDDIEEEELEDDYFEASEDEEDE